MRRARLAAAWLALLAAPLAAPVAAHEHWIAPSSFRPALGERVDVRLCVGHPAEHDEQPRDPRRIQRFERCVVAPALPSAVPADGQQDGALECTPIPGLDGRSPAGFFAADAAGLATLVYRSHHAFVAIEPAAYARFLAEEGLDDVQAERERRGETALAGRDSYLRCDKALLRVAGGPTRGFDRALGLPAELVLESDPARWTPGAELVVRFEADGAPLAGRQVKLMRLSAPFTTALARTDAHGRARFTPADGGALVVAALHQRRARPEQGLEGDWEGLWASLSFELDGAAQQADRDQDVPK